MDVTCKGTVGETKQLKPDKLSAPKNIWDVDIFV